MTYFTYKGRDVIVNAKLINSDTMAEMLQGMIAGFIAIINSESAAMPLTLHPRINVVR